MFNGTFSPNGFSVVADNALDYVVGVEAAGAGHVGATVRQLGRTLHTDVDALTRTVAQGSADIVATNRAGFDRIGQSVAGGFSSMKVLSVANLAVSAIGFTVVAKQLHSLGGDVRQLRTDLLRQGEQLIDVQRSANAKLESLVDFADRTLRTQEKILDSLVSSRTVEAQQLIRQGWDNLHHGYEEDAFSRFVKPLEFDNTVYLSHSQLGEMYAKRGDDARAEDHFRRAIAFSANATPELRGYASVQYARFLDERLRLEDAVSRVEAALELFDRNEWRFYRVELLARLDRQDLALDALSDLIKRDSRFFVAAGASGPVAAIGRPLVELLVGLDEARRGDIVDLLSENAEMISALDALSEAGPATLSKATVARLRDSAARALQEALTLPFAELDGTESATLSIAEEARREHQAALRRIGEPLAGITARWAAHDRQRPATEVATSEVSRVSASLWVVSTLLVFAYGLGILGLIYCSRRNARADEADRLRADEESALPGLWAAWVDTREQLLEEFKAEQSRVVSVLDGVAALVGDSAVEPARGQAGAQTLPKSQPIPEAFRPSATSWSTTASETNDSGPITLFGSYR